MAHSSSVPSLSPPMRLTSADGFLDIPPPPHRIRRSLSDTTTGALGAQIRRRLKGTMRNLNSNLSSAIAAPRVSIRRSLSRSRAGGHMHGSISDGGEGRLDDGSTTYAIRGELLLFDRQPPASTSSKGNYTRRRTISLGAEQGTRHAGLSHPL